VTDPPEPREELVGSRRVFQGGRLTVRVDRVRLPSGRETDREVVEHPPTVVIVPVTSDGDLILIRQYRQPVAAAPLTFPAGVIDPGEEAADAARRELREETGYAAGWLTPLLTYFTSPGYSTERQTIFRADDCRFVSEATEVNELISLVRIPLTDLPKLLTNLADPIADGKTMLGMLLLARELTVAGGTSGASRG